ncbi:hypothetical protein R3P38DRAFT_3207165 [Favolaschia claudopus]|uniref:Uncharacterized protein n=1 Tax=Favolaschia claudopus TaxID=2862362 RepID=A0AAW0AK75_9AGAR
MRFSKAGASAVAVCLSHEILGVDNGDRGGYANLLGTAMLTGIKMYSYWTTMDYYSEKEGGRLAITAVNRLPTEKEDRPQPEIDEQKTRIRTEILETDNADLRKRGYEKMKEIGSDTMINAFVCNYKIDSNGNYNRDISQANFLNQRLYDRLSVRTPRDTINDKPLIINRTEFKQNAYKDTLTSLKSRMHLDVESCKEDSLIALSNVSMSPFPTAGSFLQGMMKDFRTVAEEEITNCFVRSEERPAVHSFIIHGLQSERQFLVYLPMFHVKNHKRQLILEVVMEDANLKAINERLGSKSTVVTVHTGFQSIADLKTLDKILNDGEFMANVYEGYPTIYGVTASLASSVKIKIQKRVVDKPLASSSQAKYPSQMPFVMYGQGNELHIEHVLSKSPDVQLSASCVTLDLPLERKLGDGPWLVTLEDYIERVMQPFSDAQPPSFLTSGASLRIRVHSVKEGSLTSEGAVVTDQAEVENRTLTLGAAPTMIDYTALNEPIAADMYVVARDDTDSQEAVEAIAKKLVSTLQSGKIRWSDNVVHELKLFEPKVVQKYSVTLGVPESVADGAKFAVICRFTGPTDAVKRDTRAAWLKRVVDITE